MPNQPHPTPRSLGFFMPAEWSYHEGTWLAWPSNEETWPSGLDRVQERYIEMIKLLADGEKVHLLVDSHKDREFVRARLAETGVSQSRVELFTVPTADSWIRDYGPNFLVCAVEGVVELGFNDWIFNAWGEKYPELTVDDRIPELLSPFLTASHFEPGIVLEGGSIDVNGKGLCLTTRQCLLNPNRNSHLAKDEIEWYLNSFLGTHGIIWLDRGIAGDDTDGHIDDIARFVDSSTIVLALEEDQDNPNFEPLQENYRLLLEFSEKKQPLRIVKLPCPQPVMAEEGPLPASYANFYIGNEVVLVPTFNQPSDQMACEMLRQLFPHKRIAGIDCADIIQGMGAIHCLTQQQPYSGPARSVDRR